MSDRLKTVLIVAPSIALIITAAAVLSPTSGGAQSAVTGCDAVAQEVRETREVMARFAPQGGSEVQYKQNALAAAAQAEAACAAATTTTRPATTTTTQRPTTTTRPATTTTAPPSGGTQFPNPNNTGVPAGWAPAQVRTTTLRVTTPGAVIQDLRIDNADLEIAAPNVTVRRVQVRGGVICNGSADNVCGGVPNGAGNGLVIEDSSVEPAPGQAQDNRDHWRIGPGGYTLRRVEVVNASDGIRVGGKSFGMGPVRVEDSLILVRPPVPCGDWHGDGIQGYDGGAVTVVHTTIDMQVSAGCGGTAPFFYPRNQGNTSAEVNGLLVAGPNGNYSFRDGMPGKVTGLHIEDNSWSYGSIDVLCSALSGWQADIVGPVNRTAGGYKVPAVVRSQPCNTEGGA
ncbi:MAG TPA: hypothetical protein VH479_02665 [Acidimicrobiales bacterium]